MPPPVAALVTQALRDLRRPALVLAVDRVLTTPPDLDRVVLGHLGEPLPQDGGWAAVVLVAPDAAALRRAVSALPFLGRARAVVCVLRDRTEDEGPVPLVPRPHWPPLRQVVARVADGGGSVTRVELAAGVPVAEVLVEVARYAGTPVPAGGSGVHVAQPPGRTVPPLDTSLTVVATAEEAADPTSKVPPDAWLGAPPAGPLPEHPVTGGAPAAVGEDDLGLALGPLDEAVLNPIGFRAEWQAPVVDLDATLTAVEPGPALVAALRAHQGVRVAAVAGRERLVAGLAMAGVPLLTPGLPDRSRSLLGEDVATALLAPVELDDPAARERHSVRLRRAAQRRHSTLGWRARVAERAGTRGAAYPVPGRDVVVLGGDPGPEGVADLLLARRWSGADAVGVAARDGGDGPAERWASDVRGGPLLLTRTLARRLGGAPSAAEVVAAGGTLYLTHALQ